MKVLAEYASRKYILELKELSSLEDLHKQLKNVIASLPSKFSLQLYDKDFEEFTELLDAKQVKNLSKLKVLIEDKPPDKAGTSVLTVTKDAGPFLELLIKVKYSAALSDEDYKVVSNCLQNKFPEDNPLNGAKESCVKYANYLHERYLSSVMPDKAEFVSKMSKMLRTRFPVRDAECAKSSNKRKLETQLDTPEPKRMHKQDPRKHLLAAGALPNFLPSVSPNTERMNELVKAMKAEYQKEKPNGQKVNMAMLETLGLRRREIVMRELSVSQVKQKYPFIFKEVQIFEEFNRIANEVIEVSRMISQKFALLEKGIPSACRNFTDTPAYKNMKKQYHSIKTKEDAEKIKFGMTLQGILFYLSSDVSQLFSKMGSECAPTDHIRIHYGGHEEFLEADSYALCIAGLHVSCTDRVTALAASLAAHYVFNIPYHMSLHTFYTFVENKILGLKTAFPPTEVVTLSRRFKEYFQHKGQNK